MLHQFDHSQSAQKTYGRGLLLSVLAASALLTGCGGGLGSSTVGFEAARTGRSSTSAAPGESTATTAQAQDTSGAGSSDSGNANVASTATIAAAIDTSAAVSRATGVGPRQSSFVNSGPIIASSGQVISGVRISNQGGACIIIPPGASGVVVRDSQIGPCAGDASIVVQGNNATIEYNLVQQGRRGILVTKASGAVLRGNQVYGPFAGNSCGNASNPSHCSSAVQFDNADNGTADGNQIRGDGYGSDTLSSYESSGMRFINNDIDVGIAWKDAAPFTMGDSTTGRPGSNNYLSGNTVRQRGGVPPGIFGSGGNTLLERNCLTSGIQAYNYSGIFVGVTVRNNVINQSASFVPDAGAVSGWGSNVNSTDCSRMPA